MLHKKRKAGIEHFLGNCRFGECVSRVISLRKLELPVIDHYKRIAIKNEKQLSIRRTDILHILSNQASFYNLSSDSIAVIPSDTVPITKSYKNLFASE